MSHNLFGNRFAESQGEGRVRAWHRLGQTFDSSDRITASDAVREANMGYRIKKFPVSIDMTKKSADGVVIGGSLLPARGEYAIVREPVAEDDENRVFGFVGESYSLLNNTELAELIDRVAGGKWGVETVGALGRGETAFFTLALGSWDIQGDKIEDYLLVSDTRDGTGGIVFAHTPVRVVCQNTLSWGLQSATNRVSLTHGRALAAEAEEVLSIFARVGEMAEEGRKNLSRLTEIPLSEESAKEFFARCYPEPEKPKKIALADSIDGALDLPELSKGRVAWESACDAALKNRKDVFRLFDKFNDEFPQFAETGYAGINALSEYADHEQKGRSARTRAEGAVFGDRALIKSRGVAMLLDLSK